MPSRADLTRRALTTTVAGMSARNGRGSRGEVKPRRSVAGAASRRIGRAAVLCTAVAAWLAPPAAAATAVIGNGLSNANDGTIGCGPPCTVFQANQPGAALTSPYDGTIVSWSYRSTDVGATYQLRVLRPAGGGQFLGVGTSPSAIVPNAMDTVKGPIPVSLPVKAGDLVGLRVVSAPSAGAPLFVSGSSSDRVGYFSPDLADGATAAPTLPGTGQQVLVQATIQSSPTPAPTPTPAPVSLPPPVLARSVNLQPVAGQVFVKLPAGVPGYSAVDQLRWDGDRSLWPAAPGGLADTAQKGQGFIPLSEARQLPVGTLVDTTRGVARLTSATYRTGQLQSGDFQAGVFEILQSLAGRGLTELRIRDVQSASTVCASAGKASTDVGTAVVARRLSKHVLGLLLGNAKGRFRTTGRFSAATVRGTQWGVRDRCDGTLTRVQRGVVIVRDFRLRRNITVRAGKTYLARARP